MSNYFKVGDRAKFAEHPSTNPDFFNAAGTIVAVSDYEVSLQLDTPISRYRRNNEPYIIRTGDWGTGGPRIVPEFPFTTETILNGYTID